MANRLLISKSRTQQPECSAVVGSNRDSAAVAARSSGFTDVEQVSVVVQSLDIPIPWNLDAFVDAVAIRRGKPVRLIARPGMATIDRPSGLWIGRAEEDIIVYDDTTSRYHAEQIVLHELGHMLLEHDGVESTDASLLALSQLIPDVDPKVIRQLLGRSAFDTKQECEAELFASLVMSRPRNRSLKSLVFGTFLRD